MPTYSQRLPSAFGENALTVAIAERKRQRGSILDLSVSNPTRCLDGYPHELIREALANIRDFNYAPEPFGNLAARTSIADYYRDRGIAIPSGQLILTASTSEAYGFLFKLLCNPDDEVLIPVPSYPLFAYLAALESVRVLPYSLRYDGSWHIDLQTVEVRISRRTKAIVIVNPNNPTGTFLSRDEERQLLSLAVRHDVPVISDEVFTDYAFARAEKSKTSLAGSDSVLTFSLNGLSKTAGMPQMKLAWVAVSGPFDAVSRALERMEIIADTYLSVATPVQNALPKLLDIGSQVRQALIDRIEANLEQLDALIQSTAVHRLHLDGGWSAILQLPRTRAEEEWAVGLLTEHGVITQPGYFFDMAQEAFIVVSLITPREVFDRGIRELCLYVARHS